LYNCYLDFPTLFAWCTFELVFKGIERNKSYLNHYYHHCHY